MLHAICDIPEPLPDHAPCYLQHFGAATFHSVCYLQLFGAGTCYFACGVKDQKNVSSWQQRPQAVAKSRTSSPRGHGLLAGLLSGWLANLLARCLPSWLACLLAGWLACLLAGWLAWLACLLACQSSLKQLSREKNPRDRRKKSP